MYRPASPVLKSIREGIDYDAGSLRSVLANKKFAEHWGELGGEKVKTSPKGYSKDHPDIDLIRHKDFIAQKSVDTDFLMQENFVEKAAYLYQAVYPLNGYLNQAISEAVES